MADARATRTREARQRAPADADRRRQREPLKRRPPANLKPMMELYGEPENTLDHSGQVSASGVLPDDYRIAGCDSLEQLDADQHGPTSLVRSLEQKQKGQTVGLEAGHVGVLAQKEKQR